MNSLIPFSREGRVSFSGALKAPETLLYIALVTESCAI